MTCYIISVEVESEAIRLKIRDTLRGYSGFCPINKTCWAITTQDKKAPDIRDDLAKVAGSADKIFVIKSGVEAAWRNALSDKHSEWLKKHL